MDTKKLMRKLNEANENLKRFSHVNKKALDQYVSFSEQREALLQRKEETDKGEAAIKELIESLDMQKDEVGHHFFFLLSFAPSLLLYPQASLFSFFFPLFSPTFRIFPP